ncbi:MAG: hypothetical protein WAN93_09075 [Solirubrobacteraceae bacterium]
MKVSSGLHSSEKTVQSEVAASRGAWPLIAGGLPQTLSPALQHAVGVASASAQALSEPAFLANARQLTGPAAGIAGLYESYEQLAKRGWRLTEATIGAILSGPPAVASFERESSSLYIDSIYDGHFNLSLIGKDLTSAYEHLGGSKEFGASLTQSEINALATAYSIPAVRLEPHPQGAAKKG